MHSRSIQLCKHDAIQPETFERQQEQRYEVHYLRSATFLPLYIKCDQQSIWYTQNIFVVVGGGGGVVVVGGVIVVLFLLLLFVLFACLFCFVLKNCFVH